MPETAADMEQALKALRAVAESTRLRLLYVLSRGEFNVSELTHILQQSQPRISRHLRLMTEAGLLERHKEGSWVLFRMREDGAAAALARAVTAFLPEDDPLLAEDLSRLEEVRRERAQRAANYFAAVARDWDRIRSLHVSEEQVEAAMRALIGDAPKWRLFVDLGTGTGRILELFAPHAEQALGLDLSHEMMAIARARLDAAGLNHAQVRKADIYDIPLADGVADFVTLHQVLHYLDDPDAALKEVARILASKGRLLVVDFAPHELEFLREDHAHRRLGISDAALRRWLKQAGLTLVDGKILPQPPDRGEQGLTVSLWLVAREE